jgi:sterol desaturase/sphingolipid hydroxylase (fatty acid hydroxylase superfamily)
VYIHPLEAFLYYCILYAPPFLFHTPLLSFIGYMIIMGLCGTIDHSGVKMSIPGFYDASGEFNRDDVLNPSVSHYAYLYV